MDGIFDSVHQLFINRAARKRLHGTAKHSSQSAPFSLNNKTTTASTKKLQN